jgi:hypothetical protein
LVRLSILAKLLVSDQRAGSFLDSAFHHVCLATHDGNSFLRLVRVFPDYCSCPEVPKIKKADVAEHPKVFHHVGLLFNKPPGKTGLLSI